MCSYQCTRRFQLHTLQFFCRDTNDTNSEESEEDESCLSWLRQVETESLLPKELQMVGEHVSVSNSVTRNCRKTTKTITLMINELIWPEV